MRLIKKSNNIGNHEVFYLEGREGLSGSKYPIVFLHGWGFSSSTFQASLNILSQNYLIIAPDLPGFGRSKIDTSSWEYEDYAKVILSLINALGVEQVHLIGNSMGGGVAIRLTSLAPTVVRSLTLIDSTGIPIGSFFKLFFQRLIELPAQMISTKFSFHHLIMIQTFLFNAIFRTKNVISALRLPLAVDISSVFSTIACPCLVLWGSNDRTISLKIGQEISRQIKGSKLRVIEGGHHEWSVLMPEKCSSIISDFIEVVDRQEEK